MRSKGGGALLDIANEASSRLNETIEAIRATPAEGLFGLAAKLASLPHHWQAEDVEEGALAVLVDINRILGTDFQMNTGSSLDSVSDDDDDDEAEDDADA